MVICTYSITKLRSHIFYLHFLSLKVELIRRKEGKFEKGTILTNFYWRMNFRKK